MRIIFLVLALALSTGCATQTHYVNSVPINEEPSSPSKQSWNHFFIGGIGQEQERDAAEICGGAEKVVKTSVQNSFLNGLVNILSYGIYTPRTSKVYCAD